MSGGLRGKSQGWTYHVLQTRAAEASALESVNAKIASRISGIESTTMHSYKEIDLLWGVAVGSKRDSRPEPSTQRQISSARG
jgi:hypothetical protein